MEAGEKDSAIAAEIDLLDLDLDLVLTALELDALSATEDSTATCHHGTDDSWSSDDDPFVQSPFLEESSCVASSVSTHNSLSPTVQDSSLSDSVTSEKKTSDMPQVMIVQKEEAFDGEDASILSVVKYKGPKKNAWSFRLRQLLTFVEVYGRYPTKTDKVICHVGAKLCKYLHRLARDSSFSVSIKLSQRQLGEQAPKPVQALCFWKEKPTRSISDRSTRRCPL